jgi:hypothetical protein
MKNRSRTDSTMLLEGIRLVEVARTLKKLPGELGPEELSSRIAAFDTALQDVARANASRGRAIAEKTRVRVHLCTQIAQLRAAVKGLYGADSTEYGEIGGTRTSARKRPKRRHTNGAEPFADFASTPAE